MVSISLSFSLYLYYHNIFSFHRLNFGFHHIVRFLFALVCYTAQFLPFWDIFGLGFFCQRHYPYKSNYDSGPCNAFNSLLYVNFIARWVAYRKPINIVIICENVSDFFSYFCFVERKKSFQSTSAVEVTLIHGG